MNPEPHPDSVAAQRASGAVALRFEDQAWSYGRLDEAVSSAVAALRAEGVGNGMAFAMLCENRPELMIAYYAARRIGAVFIPVNPSLKPAEVGYVFEHSGAQVLFHDQAMEQVAAEAVPAERRRGVGLLAQGAAGAPASDAGPAGEGGDFLIVYTSGSTGQPKAVVFDWAAERAGNAALIEMWGMTARDVMVVALPLGFLYGLSTAAATGLQAGCEVVLLRRFHPARVLEAFTERQATIFHGVPTMFAMMLNYAEDNDLTFDLSFMRLLICAGAPLDAGLRQRWVQRFGKPIDDYYALTEVRPIFGRPHGDGPVPAGAVGKAAPGAQIRIVDAEGRDAPPGEPGELLVRGASTMLRYYKDPAQTAAAMRDGYFATGDIGYCDVDGYYRLTGRIKDLIIRGGANIAPAEVENVLSQHPCVREAAVVGCPDATFGELPVAFVTLREAVPGDTLIAHCRQALADFKVPVRVDVLAEFPLGITGKIDKIVLRQMAKDRA